MKNFINGNNFTPKPLRTIKELGEIQMQQVKGVVISNAISSDVDETYTQVVQAIRKSKADLPVAFATLVDFDMIKKSLQMNMESLYDAPLMTNIDNYNSDASKTTRENLFLVLHKDDISDPERMHKANGVIHRHFS